VYTRQGLTPSVPHHTVTFDRRTSDLVTSHQRALTYSRTYEYSNTKPINNSALTNGTADKSHSGQSLDLGTTGSLGVPPKEIWRHLQYVDGVSRPAQSRCDRLVSVLSGNYVPRAGLNRGPTDKATVICAASVAQLARETKYIPRLLPWIIQWALFAVVQPHLATR